MSPPKIHNFIQIWSKKTGTITWKETFVETPEGEKERRLVVTFRSGEHVRTFHLGGDISSVLTGRGRERRSCLCLTLQDSSSLLIGRPSCIGLGQKAQLAAGHEPPYGSCSTQIGSRALPSRKTPSPVWRPPALGKKVLPSGLEVKEEEEEEEDDLVPTKKRWLAFPLEAEQSQHSRVAQAALEAPAEQRWRGFPNLGNTCYTNAELQALFAIPSFADGLLSQGVPWERIPAGALLTPMSLLLLLKDVCQVEAKEELLAGIKGAVSAVAEAFVGNQQNDAHEFLGQCLHQLKDKFAKLNTTWNTQGGNPPPQGGGGQAATGAFACPVEANFEFEMQISMTCKVCGWAVIRTEPSNHLSLDLQQGPKQGTEAPPLSVQSAFDLFFAAEELEYSCERCCQGSAMLWCRFRRLPPVLIVHLKRYSFTQAWLLVKSDRQVGISKYLMLSSQCDADTAPPRPLARSAQVTSEPTSPPSASVPPGSESPDSLVPLCGPDRDAGPQEFQRIGEPVSTPDSAPSDVRLQEVPENPEPQKTDPEGIQGRRRAYRLVSMVSHVGRSHRSGHYVSDVYDFEKQAWFMYNDLRVLEIPEAVMQELRTHTGYIFFYMHSEIFEALLEKVVSSQELSAQAEVIPWGDLEVTLG
ncbi:ubiquitin carboxyl-terminal hydrolase 29-like [Sciurus carolinensis]|uniref:ubiquitin carboxyl-terminal hydrolase 29-like n=1 Tax=Sciurus carolinensis TaxID=30640 RepID=UPI001FB48CEF|nr:ubiquitin carboxyl-terminal hydrolase 29-like [Sciurus carolinensis]